MSFTIVPLHNLDLPTNTRVEFGSGFVLQQLPAWVKHEPILKGLSRRDIEGVSAAMLALVAEYPASAIGEPDPNWKGKEPRSIQKIKTESAILASIALWLMQPSPVCYTLTFHAISWNVPGQEKAQPIIQQIETQTPVYCHPKDVQNVVTSSHVAIAGQLHTLLAAIPRNNPVWEALRPCWAALTMYSADRRYRSSGWHSNHCSERTTRTRLATNWHSAFHSFSQIHRKSLGIFFGRSRPATK